jgi:hypothetical protein
MNNMKVRVLGWREMAPSADSPREIHGSTGQANPPPKLTVDL